MACALPGTAGEIVRLGLHGGRRARPRASPGAAGSRRASWARAAPTRCEPAAVSPADDARADAAAQGAAPARTSLLVILDAGARASSSAPTATRGRRRRRSTASRAEGVVFERAYTPAVYTLGAMSSVWTSQYPDRHHSEVSFSARLPKDRLTLAELLSAQGIHTGGFVANAVAGRAVRLRPRLRGVPRGLRRRWAAAATSSARSCRPGSAQNRDRRFFAYVHFREPHFPYDPSRPSTRASAPTGRSRRRRGATSALLHGRQPGPAAAGAEELEHLVRLYDGNLAFADQELGRAAPGARERGPLGEDGRDRGRRPRRGALRARLDRPQRPALRGERPRAADRALPEGAGPAGVRVAGLVDLLDLAPTIADVFGVLGKGGSDREFQGRSLLPVIAGAPGKPAVLSRTVWDRPRYALRDERFKFVYDTRTGEEELYDLAADPGETHDLAAAEPLRAAYYRQALHHWTLRLARRGPGRRGAGRARPASSART